MTDIMKMKYNGEEIYPQTHAKAVLGLSTIIGPQGPKGETGSTGATGPMGPQGPAGNNIKIIPTSKFERFISINSVDKELTIPGDTIFIWGNNYYVIIDDQIINYDIGSTAIKFVFNTETKEILVKSYSSKESGQELVFATFRTSNKKMDIGAPYTVDQRYMGIEKTELKILASSSGEALAFDTIKQTLTIFSDTLFFWGAGWGTGGRSTGATKIIVNYAGLGTSAILFCYNIKTGAIDARSFSAPLSGSEVIFATLRTNGTNIDCSAMYTVNKKPLGIESSTSKDVIINGYSDYIKNSHHRGSNIKYPESTLLAYKQSYLEGTRIIEIDLSWTSDSVPVVLHDETINRTARNIDGSVISDVKKINSITFDEARTYDFGVWKGSDFKGQVIPKFEEIIELCIALDMKVYVDRAGNMTLSQWSILKTIIDKYNAIDRLAFMIGAGATQLTNQMRVDFPNCEFMILEFGDITDKAITTCNELNTETGHCFLFPIADLVTEAQIKKASSSGLEVRLWNNILTTKYRKFLEWGVKGFQTDGYNVKELIMNDF